MEALGGSMVIPKITTKQWGSAQQLQFLFGKRVAKVQFVLERFMLNRCVEEAFPTQDKGFKSPEWNNTQMPLNR